MRKLKKFCTLENCFECPYEDCIAEYHITEEQRQKNNQNSHSYYQKNREKLKAMARERYRKSKESK